MTSERRTDLRQKAFIPLSIDSGTGRDALGVTRDASKSGARFHTRRFLEVGQAVKLTFVSLQDGVEDQNLSAKVVRIDPNPSDSAYLWPNLVAVEFDLPSDQLQKSIDVATELEGRLIG